MKTVEDAVRQENGIWFDETANAMAWFLGNIDYAFQDKNGLVHYSREMNDPMNDEWQFVCTREQFEAEAERLGYRRELNPTTSNATDSQVREFAKESGTCSDGLTCGPTYCDRCPNRNPVDDPVNHPTHYTSGEIECIDAIRAALTPEEFRGFCKGNVIKYVWRSNLKGGDQDLKKAVWYASKATEPTNG